MGKERKRFIIPDLDSDTHENMIEIFNEMLENNNLNYEVIITEDGEHLQLMEKTEK